MWFGVWCICIDVVFDLLSQIISVTESFAEYDMGNTYHGK